MAVGALGLVTDSTTGIAPEAAAAAGIDIVPLHVVIGNEQFTEGVDIGPAQVAAALRRGAVTTSRPSPTAFLDRYERLAAAGAVEIVSAHISAQLSGTSEAARLAARRSPVPVHVVDSGTTGAALGFAVRAAAILARAGRSGGELAAELRTRCAASRVLFYVNSLEQLRRGGRIGAAASLLGGALAVKPLLTMADGHVEPLERLRTAGRALARLAELAGDTARAVAQEEGGVAVAIQHLGAQARAEELAERIGQAEPGLATAPEIGELPAVLAAHLGPGTIAVVAAPPLPGSVPSPAAS